MKKYRVHWRDKFTEHLAHGHFRQDGKLFLFSLEDDVTKKGRIRVVGVWRNWDRFEVI